MVGNKGFLAEKRNACTEWGFFGGSKTVEIFYDIANNYGLKWRQGCRPVVD